ncbi:MAG: uroporphyrinogen-III synthase [Rhodobacteraceae bacterium]|nr:uroporphyrinogen-III synthase [Paracoccaceae bacterium]
MTRPRAAAERFVRSLHLDPARCDVLYSPLIETATTGALPDLSKVGALIFTSGAGVASYQALGGLPDFECYTVGATTARAAEAAGFSPISAEGDADALVALLCGETPPSPLLHIRGTYSRGAVAARLSAAGIPCQEAILYDQPSQAASPEALRRLAAKHTVIAPLFSPRTASLFADLPMHHGSVHAIAMSQPILDEVAHLPLAAHVMSDAPTGAHMRDTVLRHLKQATVLEAKKTDR